MRPNNRAHDPFAPHRSAVGPAPRATRPARRRGGRRKRTAAQPEQAPRTPAVEPAAEPVDIPRATEAEPEASEQVAEHE